MKNKAIPLVSIITPCFNGEKFIQRYIESILNQTYKNIEFIFIDDGSTDNTKNIALQYKAKFEEKGYIFRYIYQNNSGQAAALNQGLNIFEGDYLTWPDSDDVLANNSIEEKVEFLNIHSDYSMVRSNGYYFNNNSMKSIGRISSASSRFNENIFFDLFTEKTFCSCGCYMLRSGLFFTCYPDRQIYAGIGSQNWQLLVPAASKSKCGFIDKDLYFVYSHHDSFCRKSRDFDGWILRYEDHINILYSAFDHSTCDIQFCRQIVDKIFIRKKIELACKFRNIKYAKNMINILTKEGYFKVWDYIYYLRIYSIVFNFIYIVINKAMRNLRNKILKLT